MGKCTNWFCQLLCRHSSRKKCLDGTCLPQVKGILPRTRLRFPSSWHALGSPWRGNRWSHDLWTLYEGTPQVPTLLHRAKFYRERMVIVYEWGYIFSYFFKLLSWLTNRHFKAKSIECCFTRYHILRLNQNKTTQTWCDFAHQDIYSRNDNTKIYYNHLTPWWRHQMETFSALLALCAGNSPVTGEFPAQRPVTRTFDIFFDLRLSKNVWVNNGEAGDLRHHRAHYDFAVMHSWCN